MPLLPLMYCNLILNLLNVWIFGYNLLLEHFLSILQMSFILVYDFRVKWPKMNKDYLSLLF